MKLLLYLSIPGMIMVSGSGKIYKKEAGSKAFPFERGNMLKVKTENGDIRVEKYEGNQLKVEYEKYVRTSNKEKAEKALNHIKITFNKTEDGIEINASLPHSVYSDMGVNFHILMPYDGDLVLKALNGDVSVDGLEGHIHASSNNGDVSLNNIEGDIEAHTANGDITMEDVKGIIKAETNNGEIEYSLSSCIDTSMIELESNNGEIDVYLPEGTKPSIYASSVNGKVSSDYPIYTDESQLKGPFKISAIATNGSVEIRKR